jgi:hypothetical protein
MRWPETEIAADARRRSRSASAKWSHGLPDATAQCLSGHRPAARSGLPQRRDAEPARYPTWTASSIPRSNIRKTTDKVELKKVPAMKGRAMKESAA